MLNNSRCFQSISIFYVISRILLLCKWLTINNSFKINQPKAKSYKFTFTLNNIIIDDQSKVEFSFEMCNASGPK